MLGYVAQAFEELYYGKSPKTGWKKILNQSSKLPLTMPMHLIQQLQLWKALDFIGKYFLTVVNVLCIFLKPGLPISSKDRKHMFANAFLFKSFLRMPWSSHSCNDRRYSSYFTRHICNRCADTF